MPISSYLLSIVIYIISHCVLIYDRISLLWSCGFIPPVEPLNFAVGLTIDSTNLLCLRWWWFSRRRKFWLNLVVFYLFLIIELLVMEFIFLILILIMILNSTWSNTFSCSSQVTALVKIVPFYVVFLTKRMMLLLCALWWWYQFL